VTLTPHHNSLLEKAEKDTVINSVGDPDSHVLGLPDPDQSVTGMDPAPDASFFS
jgi:hypothetical protein